MDVVHVNIQDIVRRFGPSLKDPAVAEPVAYDAHFDRLLREAEKGSAAAGRRASPSPKVRRFSTAMVSKDEKDGLPS